MNLFKNLLIIVVIDGIDLILIDEARTPLILSTLKGEGKYYQIIFSKKQKY
jgi:preprotein translocase subunit SecA